MESLKQERRWCLWKRVEREGRSTKVPFCNVSQMSKSNDPELWLSYDQAQRMMDEHDGVFAGKGIFLSARDNGLALCAIDIDAHEMEQNPYTEEILGMFSGTYAERSPSGKGYHIIFEADINRIPKDEAGRIDYRINNREKELEVYVGGTTNKYMTYSADQISETSQVTDQTDTLLSFLNLYMKKPARGGRHRTEHDTQHVTTAPQEYTPTHDIDIEERLNIARRAEDGEYFIRLYDYGDISHYDDDMSRATFALLLKLAYWLEGDVALIDRAFRSSALMREKWDERRGETTWGGMEIEAALDRCETFYRALTINDHPLRQWYDALGFHSMDVVEDKPDVSVETGENISPKDVLHMINDIASDEAKRDTISVLPLMCGTGKSSAIRLKIIQTIEANDGNGLLIITDNLDRIRDYLTPNDAEMRQFFLDYSDKIMAITPDIDVRTALAEMHSYPVLIMTTQRYTKSSRRMIREYLRWDGGTRPLIIVDERPYFFEQTCLTLDSFSEVYHAFHEGLPLDNGEEDWGGTHGRRNELCEGWQVISDYIEQVFNGFNDKFPENDTKVHYFLWKPTGSMDELFRKTLPLCELYRNQLNQNITVNDNETYTDIVGRVRLIHRLYQVGCLVSYQRRTIGGIPQKSMWVMMDHIDCYTNLAAKVIILDGTADISTEYQMDHRVEVIDCSQYRRRLDRMTIDIVDMSTGKTRLKQSKADQREVFDKTTEYLSRALPEGVAPAIFTYSFLETPYTRRYGAQNVAHFGIIRGSNDYRDKTHIAQVGLNYFQPQAYFLYELENNPELRYQFLETEDFSFPEQSDIIKSHIKDTDGFTTKVMYQELLAELEQNIFRGVIRKASDTTSYTFYLFTSHYTKTLLDAVRNRFTPLGANVVLTRLPRKPKTYPEMRDIILVRRFSPEKLAKQPMYIQIAIWHDRMLPNDADYTYADITETLHLSTDQINKARENFEYLDTCLKQEKIGGRPVKYRKCGTWCDPLEDDPF